MPSTTASVFLELFKFIYEPNKDREQNYSIYRNIYRIVLLFIVSFPLTIILTVIITHLTKESSKIDENVTEYNLTFFLLMCWVAPLIEEIAFRLPLRYSKRNLSLSMTVLSFYIVNCFFTLKNNFDIENYFVLRIAISVLCGFLFYLFCKKNENNFLSIYKNNFKLIFYFFCLSFALIHIVNYDLTVKALLLTPLITLPKLISAFLNGFIRIKYGFIYGLFFHISHNVLIFIIISSFSTK